MAALRRSRSRAAGPTAAPRPSTPTTRGRRRPATAASVPRAPARRHPVATGPAPRRSRRADGPGLANSAAQLAHQHPSGLPADPAGRRGDHVGRTPHQRLHGRHAAAGSHAAAHQDDQAGDRAGTGAPGGAGPVCRSAVQRCQARDGLQGHRSPGRTDRARKAFLEATRDIPNSTTTRRWSPSAPTRTRSPSRSTGSAPSARTHTPDPGRRTP